MASSTDSVALWISIEKYTYRIGGPILLLIGSVSCIINLLVFTQKNLRKNPCSVYFIAYNVSNFLFIYSHLLPLALLMGYKIDPSLENLPLCRVRIYASILFNCLSSLYLILASIDRVLVTSANALTRQRSTLRLTYTCLTGGTLFWALFHTHALILVDILPLGPTYFVCYFQMGVYLAFVTYYLLMKEIVAFALMVIFGLWSIRNVRHISRVTVSVDVSTSRVAKEVNLRSTFTKDRQLSVMLLVDLIIYILFSFLYATLLLFQQITKRRIKTAEQIQIEEAITNLCLFGAAIPYCTSLYANLVVSKTFRREAKKIFSWTNNFLHRTD